MIDTLFVDVNVIFKHKKQIQMQVDRLQYKFKLWYKEQQNFAIIGSFYLVSSIKDQQFGFALKLFLYFRPKVFKHISITIYLLTLAGQKYFNHYLEVSYLNYDPCTVYLHITKMDNWNCFAESQLNPNK